ncbi:MAG: ABC transporter substrate-binding protein [Armatimonadota bacterium]
MLRRTVMLAVILTLVVLSLPLSSGAQPRGKTLTYVLAQEPISMDPAVITESQSGLPVRHVYDRLIEMTPDGRNVVPGLAEKWEVSRDGLTYTFHIRQGVKFHSGATLTPEAVRFSFERTLALGKSSSFLLKEYLDPRNIRATGPNTITFRLSRPYSPILTIIGFHNIGSIVNPQFVRSNATPDDPWATKWLATHMDGTGPFRFVEWQPKQFLAIERNPGYWKGSAKLERIIFIQVPERTTARLMLERGEVDIIHNMPTDLIDAMRVNPDIVIAEKPGFETTYWAFNNQMPPFNNVKVRQALSYAVDYDAIMTFIVRGGGIRMRGVLPRGLPGSDETIAVPSRDVGKAKAMLAEAGFPSGFTVTTHYPIWRDLANIVQVLQANFADVGVKLELQQVPLPTLVQVVVQGTSPFFPWVSTPTYADPDAVMFSKFHSAAAKEGASGNIARYSNATVDRLLDQARATNDRGTRLRLYREVQRTVTREAAWIFLFQSVLQVPHRRWVQGYEMPLIGVANLYPVDVAR